MAISAAFTVNAVANPAAHAVAYGATVACTLTSLTGVNSVTWEILAVSHSSMTAPTIVTSGALGSTATYTQVADPGDGGGRSLLIRCTARDSVGNIVRQSAVIGSAATLPIVPFVPGETTERSSTQGWAGLNSLLVGTGVNAANLTDAIQTINVGTAGHYTLPAATLTANRNKTLGTTGATTGATITIRRYDVGAFTVPVINGGGGAGTIFTFPVSVRVEASFRYDGTNWALVGWSPLGAIS